MEPISSSLSVFHATYRIILFSIDIEQVPSQIRRSLELVQTCHRDLQHLIEIRNECLSLLQKTPIVMNRVNEIIAAATQGLVEVCQIVEKCRPGAHNGSIPFKNRVSWVMFDSKEFKAHEPVISRHHSSVLSELNFLRQSALLAAHTGEKKPVTPGIIRKSTEIFDNVALLGGLMSGMVVSGETPSNPPSAPTEAANPVSHTFNSHPPKNDNINPCPHPPPPPYARYSRSPPASDSKITDSTYVESSPYREAPRDPSYRRPVPPSQQIPQPDLEPRNFGTLQERERFPYVEQYQPDNPTVAAAPSPYPSNNITATGPFDPSLSRSHSSSTQSTMWPRNPRNGTYPPTFPESYSNAGVSTEGISREQNPYSPSSGYCGSTREQPRNFHDPYGHGASHLRHAASHAGLSNSSSNPNHQVLSRSSTVTSHEWHSPNSIHAWQSPNHSTTTLRSDASTWVSQSPTPASFDTVSMLSLATACEPVSPIDRNFERSTLATRHSISTFATPSPVNPVPYPTEPFDSSRGEDNLSAPRSLASRSHSEAANPALLFGSAFWGASASHDYDTMVQPTMQTTRSYGDLNRGALYEVDSIPVYRDGQNTRQASSYADFARQNNKNAASINSYEVSYPYSPADRVELP